VGFWEVGGDITNVISPLSKVVFADGVVSRRVVNETSQRVFFPSFLSFLLCMVGLFGGEVYFGEKKGGGTK